MGRLYLPPLMLSQEVLWLFLAAGTALGLGLVARSVSRDRLRNYSNGLLSLAGVAALLGVFMLISSAGSTFMGFYVRAIFASPWAAPVAGILGLILFAIRKTSLATYAAIEIAGACITLCIVGFNTFGSPGQRAAALLTAMYFLIRGLDNAEKGKLHLQLFSAFRSMRKQPRRKLAIGALIATSLVALLISVVVMPSAFSGVKPPYLSGVHGERLPVSPMACGASFIVCDESAWRERERLARGTPADRAKAQADAERRYEEMKHPRK